MLCKNIPNIYIIHIGIRRGEQFVREQVYELWQRNSKQKKIYQLKMLIIPQFIRRNTIAYTKAIQNKISVKAQIFYNGIQ